VPGAANTIASPGQKDSIRVEFAPLQGGAAANGRARAAGALSSAITPGQWVQLIARLGEIPDPKVGSGPSAASVPDHPGTAIPGTPATGPSSTGTAAEGKETGGNH